MIWALYTGGILWQIGTSLFYSEGLNFVDKNKFGKWWCVFGRIENWKKENLLVTSMLSFLHNAFLKLLPKSYRNTGLVTTSINTNVSGGHGKNKEQDMKWQCFSFIAFFCIFFFSIFITNFPFFYLPFFQFFYEHYLQKLILVFRKWICRSSLCEQMALWCKDGLWKIGTCPFPIKEYEMCMRKMIPVLFFCVFFLIIIMKTIFNNNFLQNSRHVWP